MTRLAATRLLLLAIAIAAASPAAAVDPQCMQTLTETANRERQQVGIYVAEMNNLTTNNRARNAMSICRGALARADNYLNRHTANEDVCDSGTSYVDNQIIHLFKNAESVCRDLSDDVARSLSDDEQRLFRAAIDRNLRAVQ